MAPVPTRAGPRFRRRRRAVASALLHVLLRAPAVAAFAAPARSAPPQAARVASPRAVASDAAEDVAAASADAVATLSELAGAGAGSTKTKFSPEDVAKYLAAIDGLPAPPAGLDVDGGWEYVPRDRTNLCAASFSGRKRWRHVLFGGATPASLPSRACLHCFFVRCGEFLNWERTRQTRV